MRRLANVVVEDILEHFLLAALDFGFAVFEGVGFEVVKAGLAVFDFGAPVAVPAGGAMSCVRRAFRDCPCPREQPWACHPPPNPSFVIAVQSPYSRLAVVAPPI